MIICPRCEKEIHAEEPHTCQRKFSRRFFFGLMAGGVMAAAAKELPATKFNKFYQLRPGDNRIRILPPKFPYTYSANFNGNVWVVTEAEIDNAGKFLEDILDRSDLAVKFSVQLVEWSDKPVAE